MFPPVLTRYLYLVDEVLYTLLYGLVNKTSLEECKFWLGEAYYSGYQTILWNSLWRIYYDFFAIQFPKYERKITKLYRRSGKESTILHLVLVVHLLYHSPIDTQVFELHILQPTFPNKIYIGRPPKWLKAFEASKRDRNLLRSIHEGDFINISYYITFFKETPEKAYNLVKRYFCQCRGYQLKEKALSAVPYPDKLHIVLATICYLLRDKEDIHMRLVCIRLDRDKCEDEYKISNKTIAPTYRTLVQHRKYSVSRHIGCFDLSRFRLPKKDDQSLTPSQILWYHWEYFAYGSPIWKKRFDKIKSRSTTATSRSNFQDIDEEEAFYEKYYYEPDEQSKATQACSILEIPSQSLLEWLEGISGEKQLSEKLKERMVDREKYLYIPCRIELEESAIRSTAENTVVHPNRSGCAKLGQGSNMPR